MKQNTTYRLTLQPLPGIDGEQALRAALKRLLRNHGLKCTAITADPATLARNQQAMHRAALGDDDHA